MKRTFAHILLVSLLVGVSQPVMPMFEYLLSEGEITTLLFPTDKSAQCELAAQRGVNCEVNCPNDVKEDVLLLDGDYYPIPVSIHPVAKAAILPEAQTLYTPPGDRWTTRYLIPLSPPPRIA
ncbi:MAG: hypothetical protein ACQER4_05200 [Bacteroidota bacterium]